jgi:hypothetical protein
MKIHLRNAIQVKLSSGALHRNLHVMITRASAICVRFLRANIESTNHRSPFSRRERISPTTAFSFNWRLPALPSVRTHISSSRCAWTGGLPEPILFPKSGMVIDLVLACHIMTLVTFRSLQVLLSQQRAHLCPTFSSWQM